jgi:hypothetical protein
MRKKLSILIAAVLACIGALTLAPAANADTYHYVDLACTSGGSTFKIHQQYISHLPFFSSNETEFASWDSDPRALFNRVTLSESYDGQAPWYVVYSFGGTSATVDDVPSHGSNVTDVTFGSSVYLRLSVWGGVGGSTDSCLSNSHHVF